MRVIKVPMKFAINQEKAEECENLGIAYEPELEDGFLYINVDQIIAFNEATDGTTTIALPDGHWSIPLKIDEFMEILKK